MTKIRIYELARELGVDNKVVIMQANQLGLATKSSHSHSLESDEADQIRRALLRSAMGSPAEVLSAKKPQPQVVDEVVTTRIASSGGVSEAVVERRKGDVIVRRRQAPASATPASVASSPQDQEASSPKAEHVLPTQEAVATPQVHADIAASDSHTAQETVADVQSEPSLSQISAVREQPSVEKEAPAELDEVAAKHGLQETATHDLTVNPSRASEIGSTISGAAELTSARAATVAADSGARGSTEIREAKTAAEPPPAMIIPSLRRGEIPTSEAPAEGEDKKFGPRILGRIELPSRKAKLPVEARKPLGTVGGVKAAPEVVDEDEEVGARKAKSRKREIARIDLVDYEGRETRRTGKTAKQKGSLKDKGSMTAAATEVKGPKASKRVVKISEAISVGDLAHQMSLKASEVIGKLISLGVMATINQLIDKDTASVICEEFGYQVESTSIEETDFHTDEGEDSDENLMGRPPVVTVMGHVDHGKTSLLDKIRQASVADKEAGGITQHIGAYTVTLPSGKKIAFIDTPGHAAFTAMRARGAKVTDIVILVVAADDGVMPQTVEALNHAKAAGAPIIVAVNKMDKHGANPDRVKQQLTEHGLQPEDWGGQTMYCPVSALKGTGIQEMLEGVLLQAEVMELKANPNRRAKGTIIETRQDRGRGTVSTVLVQNGTLKVGDVFVAGALAGRVRSMNDHNGNRLDEAGPSTPVEITGVTGIPQAGDDFFVVDSEIQARQISELRGEKIAHLERGLGGPISLEEFARRASSTAAAELNLIIKADVHGSLEAVKAAVDQLSTDKVKVKVIHAAIGGVNESDVQLAVASKAIIVGFGVRGEPRAMADAERFSIDVRFYRIIYDLIDEVKKAMAGLLEPIKHEVVLGRAEVRETFVVPKQGTVAGSFVTDGVIKRGCLARVLRDSRVIFEGKLGSLRRFKDDVKEVQRGFECGIGVENFNDVKVGDTLEAYQIEERPATL